MHQLSVKFDQTAKRKSPALQDRKKASVYCRRLGTGDIKRRLFSSQIVILDAVRKLISHRKRKDSTILSDFQQVHPPAALDFKLLSIVWNHRNHVQRFKLDRKIRKKPCESSWQGSCEVLDVSDLQTLSKYASVHWYCSKCEDKHLQGRSSNVWKSLNAIIHNRKKETKIRKSEIQIMESMKKDLLTIKLKLDNPASTQPHENHADKVKTNQNETLT